MADTDGAGTNTPEKSIADQFNFLSEPLGEIQGLFGNLQTVYPLLLWATNGKNDPLDIKNLDDNTRRSLVALGSTFVNWSPEQTKKFIEENFETATHDALKGKSIKARIIDQPDLVLKFLSEMDEQAIGNVMKDPKNKGVLDFLKTEMQEMNFNQIFIADAASTPQVYQTKLKDFDVNTLDTAEKLSEFLVHLPQVRLERFAGKINKALGTAGTPQELVINDEALADRGALQTKILETLNYATGADSSFSLRGLFNFGSRLGINDSALETVRQQIQEQLDADIDPLEAGQFIKGMLTPEKQQEAMALITDKDGKLKKEISSVITVQMIMDNSKGMMNAFMPEMVGQQLNDMKEFFNGLPDWIKGPLTAFVGIVGQFVDKLQEWGVFSAPEQQQQLPGESADPAERQPLPVPGGMGAPQ